MSGSVYTLCSSASWVIGSQVDRYIEQTFGPDHFQGIKLATGLDYFGLLRS